MKKPDLFNHNQTLKTKLICFTITALLIAIYITPFAKGEEYTFVTSWGSSGTLNGQFNSPFGVAVDSSGNVYIADAGNDRVQKFTSNGDFITKWGTQGTDYGQFNNPTGVAADSSGNIYIADTDNHRVQVFTSSGDFITKWGTPGSDDGQFNNPSAVAIDNSGNVYVTDYYNSRVQKFTNNGTYITQWGSIETDLPTGIAVDSAGNVYVTGVGGGSGVQVFTSNGDYISQLGTWGTAPGQFLGPTGVAVDNSGNIYVTEANLVFDRVQRFTSGELTYYDLTISVSGSGTTTPSVGTHTYRESLQVNIIAFPSAGWQLTNWIYDLQPLDLNNSMIFVPINENHTLTAVFTQITPSTILHEVVAEQTLYLIGTCSNSTVSDFSFNQPLGRIRFSVEETDGTTGFCNISIPFQLMSGNFSIYKDSTLLIENIDYSQSFNGTNYSFNLTYEHSLQVSVMEIFATTVIPELTSIMLIATLILSTTFVAIVTRKKKSH